MTSHRLVSRGKRCLRQAVLSIVFDIIVTLNHWVVGSIPTRCMATLLSITYKECRQLPDFGRETDCRQIGRFSSRNVKPRFGAGGILSLLPSFRSADLDFPAKV
jgi:hypothetical protein